MTWKARYWEGLYPVAHIIELEPSEEPRKTGTHLLDRKRIKLSQSIRLPPYEKRGLCDPRTLENGGQMEIWLGGAVVVQSPVEAGAPEFSDVVIDVIRFRPCRQRPGSRATQAARGIHRAPALTSGSSGRCPVQDSWNADFSICPKPIRIRSNLLEHIEIVFLAGPSHLVEDTDVSARDVRHAQAKHRLESIRTQQRRVPRVGCTPVVTHENSARDPERVE